MLLKNNVHVQCDLDHCFWSPHLFPGDFLLRTSFTNHRIFGADLIMGLWKHYFVTFKSFYPSNTSHLFLDHSLTLMFLKWNGSLQYLQLSVLSGHTRSLWRSCSLNLMSSLHKGQDRIMNSHFPSWLNYNKNRVMATSYQMRNCAHLCSCKVLKDFI